MKKSLIVLSLVCLLAACNDDHIPDGKSMAASSSKYDTIETLAAYPVYSMQGVTYGNAVGVITHDTVKGVWVDTATFKKDVLTNDTTWYIFLEIPVDSVVAKEFNVPLLDTLGRKYFIQRYVKCDPKLVRPSYFDLKKAAQEIREHLPKKDSTQK